MKSFQVKAKRSLCNNINYNKFIVILKSEIRLLKNSSKKEILHHKVTPEITIFFKLKIRISYSNKWE